jgi:lipopolysaccharide/colanic/teichoic acid biosynthesis glycosyltransferase
MIDATLRTTQELQHVERSRPTLSGDRHERSLPLDIAIPLPAVSHADFTYTDDARTDVQPRARSERLCRAMNIAIAGIAAVLLSPILLIVALAVRLSSPGPMIYMQTRVGLDRRRRNGRASGYHSFDRRTFDLGGRPFRMYKFRTMRADAERKTGVRWATRNDPRVTPLGRILRKTRLDELPQLFNVLTGDMNVVGPRPERPSIFARLSEDIEQYSMRQRTKPGITGWAQINHTYDSCIDDVKTKVRYDLEYLQRQGIAEDLLIIAKTVPVMLFRRGGW